MGLVAFKSKISTYRGQLSHQRFVLQSMRPRLIAQPLLAHRLVHGKIPFEKCDLAVAFEGHDVSGDAVEEPTIVGRNHRAAAEIRDNSS